MPPQEVGKKRGVTANEVLALTKGTALAGMEHSPAAGPGPGLLHQQEHHQAHPEGHHRPELSEGSQQVASAAGQVATSSQSLAEGASQQAAALEETSSSLEEMFSMTKTNADNAAQANSLMSESRSLVAKANESMGQLTASMDENQRRRRVDQQDHLKTIY